MGGRIESCLPGPDRRPERPLQPWPAWLPAAPVATLRCSAVPPDEVCSVTSVREKGSYDFLGVAVDRLEPGDPSQIGRFRVLGRLGEGGMGRVFLAESRGGRKVAIKVVHPRHANDPSFRRRFAHEVAAARQVGGFHAALVVDADPDANPPWMATAFIPGPSLADAIDQQGPLDEAGVRELGAALAEGLEAIHACGIIHRDLKPSNVIMGYDGPRIIDFGIAKSADASSLTASNAVLGTLRYMSPEQLNGQILTEKSDIFALGAILTYAATGHNPFDGVTLPAIITQILNNPPNLDPLAGDLRDIISACLAREPSDRPSAADLLARFNLLQGAREATAVLTAAGESAATGRAEPVPTVAMPAGASQVQVSGPQRAAVRESSTISTIDVGVAAPPASPALPAPPAPPQAAPRATPAPPVRLPASPAARPSASPPVGPSASPPVRPSVGPPVRPSVGPPARRRRRPLAMLAAASAVVVVGLAVGLALLLGRHTVTVTSATGSLAQTLSDPASSAASSVTPVTPVAFGPDGILATGDHSGNTYVWNTGSGTPARTLADSASQGVFSVAFGPDGTLAAGDNDGRTDLWNTAAQTYTPLSDVTARVVPSVAFGPGGVLATDQIGSVDIWNTATGTRITTLKDPGTGGVFSVAFGPGGILAASDDNGHVYLWDTTARKVIATLTDPVSTGVDPVAFGPGGILVAGDNGHVYVWNTAAWNVIATLTEPDTGGVRSVAFGPDGILATGDNNGHVYLWNITTGKLIGSVADPGSMGVYSVAFAPSGTLATGDNNGHAYLWKITYHKS
jgi:serine/threonine protein kinase